MSTATYQLAPASTETCLERLEAIHERATALLTEFHAFNNYLRAKVRHDEVESRIFRRGLEAEVEGLRVLISGKERSGHGLDELSAEELESKRARLLQTSNVPHYEIWWTIAKQCRGIRGLGRRIVLDGHRDGKRARGKRPNPEQGKEVQIDIMANDGEEWIKISTMSEKRLVLEMAKEGWERYNDYDSDPDEECLDAKPNEAPQVRKLELLRLAEALAAASRTVRTRYRHPHIRFILPRITEGLNSDVDALLADVRATGASVDCGTLATDMTEEQALEHCFARMLPTTYKPELTPVLNLDCSILIALLSDQCHVPPSQLPGRPPGALPLYNAAILQQMAEEEAFPLLPNQLWPLMAQRTLTCTDEAAMRMRNIVHMMGTDPEVQRADIILGDGGYETRSSAELRDALQALSHHAIPSDILLPVRVVPVDVLVLTSNKALQTAFSQQHQHDAFPHEIAHRLVRTTKLSALNAAVLLYGWAEDIVTVTSNQTAVSQIERGINAVLDEMEREEGVSNTGTDHDGAVRFREPRFWAVEGSRSLVGRKKPRPQSGAGDKTTGEA